MPAVRFDDPCKEWFRSRTVERAGGRKVKSTESAVGRVFADEMMHGRKGGSEGKGRVVESIFLYIFTLSFFPIC